MNHEHRNGWTPDFDSHPGGPSRDIRSRTTASIWGIACGMLGICIPLVAVTHSGAILPLAVIGGAAVATVAVWLGGSRGAKLVGPTETEKALKQQVANLEERLASLEVITGFEQRLLEKREAASELSPASVVIPVRGVEAGQ